MQFDYTKRDWSKGVVHVPTMPVILNGFPLGHALIDTGADVTIIPMEVNKLLGLELEKSSTLSFVGAGGDIFRAVPTKKKIEYRIEQAGHRPICWKGTVFFAAGQPTILLGNYQCLDQLKITLDGKNRKLNLVKA
tara:strand:+ start:496 stop:900 length:405 start_codon:yes stop_codon:yes gene_type:complete